MSSVNSMDDRVIDEGDSPDLVVGSSETFRAVELLTAANDASASKASNTAAERIFSISRGSFENKGRIVQQDSVSLQGLANLLRQAQAQSFPLTFDEYSALHEAERAGNKEAKAKLAAAKSTAWFNSATYKSNSRQRADLVSCTALQCDADQPGTTREKLVAALDALNVAYIVATSTSHGCGGQARYRVVIPFAKSIPADQYRAAWEAINARLAGMLDPGAKDPTRLNYMPRIPVGAIGHEVIVRDDLPWFDPQALSVPPPTPATMAKTEVLTTISDAEWNRLLNALDFLAPDVGPNSTWSECGYALLSLQRSRPIEKLWLNWSRKAAGWEDGAPEKWWESHRSVQPRSDYRHIFSLALHNGWSPTADPSLFGVTPEDASPLPVAGTVPQADHLCTDQRNANRLQSWYGKRLLSSSGSFYGYDGRRWVRDESFAARCAATLSKLVKAEAQAARAQFETLSQGNELVPPVLKTKRRDQSEAVDNLREVPNGSEILAALKKAEALERWAVQCEGSTAQQKALGLLRSMVTIDASAFDRDPMLLNCANGMVDLRTGKLKAHDPNDLVTKLVPVNYDPTATAPRWERFMVEILGEECAAFVQRFYGYAATGMTTEQCMLVKIGDGKNGKSTEVDVVSQVLGDYCDTSAIGLLTATSDRHPTEIAALIGRRLITTHESDESAVLREGLVKHLTGGDPVSARFLYRDAFTFTPTCKFQLLTNHRPVVKGADDGIWRRLRLVWYRNQFGTREEVAAGRATHVRDKDLKQRLLATEREGILAWIVRGATEWYSDGLKEPASVLGASEMYRREQNRVAKWLEECCILDQSAWSPFSGVGFLGGLYPSYVQWCRDSGHQPLSKSNFIDRLEKEVPRFRPYQTKQTVNGVRRTVRGCYGLRVNPDGVSSFTPVADRPPNAANAAHPNADLVGDAG